MKYKFKLIDDAKDDWEFSTDDGWRLSSVVSSWSWNSKARVLLLLEADDD